MRLTQTNDYLAKTRRRAEHPPLTEDGLVLDDGGAWRPTRVDDYDWQAMGMQTPTGEAFARFQAAWDGEAMSLASERELYQGDRCGRNGDDGRYWGSTVTGWMDEPWAGTALLGAVALVVAVLLFGVHHKSTKSHGEVIA